MIYNVFMNKKIFLLIIIWQCFFVWSDYALAFGIKLLPPEGNSIYFGAFPDFGGDEEDISKQKIDDFEALAQKNIMWAPFSQYWYRGLVYPQDKIHIINDEGVIPLVRMQPRSTTQEYVEETVFTMDNIINGNFDVELRTWARAAKTDNIPILIDFAVEMNGEWFPWNGSYNGGGTLDGYGNSSHPDGPERYRDAYKHIIDIFRDEEVRHVTWLFHPTMHMLEPAAEWNEPKWYYPGDDYIDWIGVSIYGPLHPGQNYWDTYDEVLELSDAYQKILDISANKPFAILELGVTDHHSLGNKVDWLEGAFDSILSNKYINFQAINYWHENWDNDGSLTSLRIDSSPEVLTAFRNRISDVKFITSAVFSTIDVRADVNQDARVDVTDALLVNRKILGLDMGVTAWQESATTGDVNCDGATDIVDTQLLVKRSVGLVEVDWCVQ